MALIEAVLLTPHSTPYTFVRSFARRARARVRWADGVATLLPEKDLAPFTLRVEFLNARGKARVEIECESADVALLKCYLAALRLCGGVEVLEEE